MLFTEYWGIGQYFFFISLSVIILDSIILFIKFRKDRKKD
jgi:hypothetical protein